MLSRRALEFAAEISSHDWSDAPYRLDRAGHQRRTDSRSRNSDQKPLNTEETYHVLTNVVWVVAQVLQYEDPNFDVYEFAVACGVPRSITHRTNGSRSGVLSNGLRWVDSEAKVAKPPGATLWRVQLQCEVANLVVFKRLLAQAVGLDPAMAPEIDSVGGTMRTVTVAVRAWDEFAAGERAVAAVSTASLEIANGTPAIVLAMEEITSVENLGARSAQRP
ncbi:hypothetical protein F0Q45_23445 [Mycobacterium simiae]|uniref:Uncharacterized protein n=1 Tax=Mycobacterium simiae TaxID=1784 RepID=A0A5B1BFT4_MYCSI|nr:hypothetical protein [Mycobacterium simiae]KAA1246253.1 hypothetical protein F0Q45_23445 [Mycobacterium simiae]